MAHKARVKVELRQNNFDDREAAFRKMFGVFKKQCSDCGIQHDYKQHQSYESKSRKLRRKRREAEIARLKDKVRENFPNKKYERDK